MIPLNREELYTLRWHVRGERAILDDRLKNALLDHIAELLGETVVKPAAEVVAAPAPPAETVAAVQRVLRSLTPLRVTPQFPVGADFPMVGRAFDRADFPRYLVGIQAEEMRWAPSLVVIHHTAAPSLAQRPAGWQDQHMLNLRSYYDGLGWNKGPHFFVDEDQVWAFSPVTHPGTHARSFNNAGIGIEMLGDFDSEDPMTGRGLEVLQMTAHATACLLQRFRLTLDAIRFHRDDPTTAKTCPGRKVRKGWFLDLVRAALPS